MIVTLVLGAIFVGAHCCSRQVIKSDLVPVRNKPFCEREGGFRDERMLASHLVDFDMSHIVLKIGPSFCWNIF